MSVEIKESLVDCEFVSRAKRLQSLGKIRDELFRARHLLFEHLKCVRRIRDCFDPRDALVVVVWRGAKDVRPLLREFTLIEEVRVVGDAIEFVREPERQFFAENEIVRVVANALVANEIDTRVDPRPALILGVGHDRNVVGHVVAVERPNIRESRLQLGDEIGICHHLIKQPLLLLQRHLDPQVVDDQTAQCANRRAHCHNRRRTINCDIGVAKFIALSDGHELGLHDRCTRDGAHERDDRSELNQAIAHVSLPVRCRWRSPCGGTPQG